MLHAWFSKKQIEMMKTNTLVHFMPGLLSLFMSINMCKRKPGLCFMGPVSLSFGEARASKAEAKEKATKDQTTSALH